MERMFKIQAELKKSSIVYRYPNELVDIVHNSCGFMEAGWEAAGAKPQPPERRSREKGKVAEGENMVRSMRRARAKLRRLALANEFKWFVTLTLDPAKIDRNDGAAVARALGRWADNMVRRKGLKYVLIPELHEKGGIHFHGFFNDAVETIASGHTDSSGHAIFNLPEWKLGFTTAIALYGDYPRAVGYVCKYIGKQKERPMGRWYYSGGALQEPTKEYVDIDGAWLDGWEDKFEVDTAIGKITVIHTNEEEMYGVFNAKVDSNDG